MFAAECSEGPDSVDECTPECFEIWLEQWGDADIIECVGQMAAYSECWETNAGDWECDTEGYPDSTAVEEACVYYYSELYNCVL